MKLVTFWRVMKLGLLNYWRNRGLSVSATLILTLTLFIVLVFYLINGILGATSMKIRDKIDLVVSFDDQVSDEQIQKLETLLAGMSEAQQVHFVSKDEAIARFQGLPGVSERTKQIVTPENNPLPRTLEIKATSPAQLEPINTVLSNSPWKEIIRRNSYLSNRDTVQRISRFERAVTTAGIALTIVFVGISLIVVINTIRLAIFARREEIEIMRLVGANNIFIRIPFIVEGILYGLVAAILALGGVWLIIQRFGGVLSPYLGEIDVNLPNMYLFELPTLVLLELVIGLGIAVFASLVSIQRYLKR